MSKNDKKKKSYLKIDDQDEEVIGKNRVGDWRSFVTLLTYAKEYRFSFIIALSLIGINGVLAIMSAKIMGPFVEEGLIPLNKEISSKYAVAIIFLEGIGLFSLWWGRRILAIAASKTLYAIRERLFEHLQVLPMSYFDHQPQGRVVTRITHDVEGIEEFFTSSLGRLLNASCMAIIATLAMLQTHFKLGLILLSSMIPVVIFIFLTREKVRVVQRKMSKFTSTLNAKLSESINGLEVIRSFGLEGWSKKNYDKAVDDLLVSQLTANRFFSWTRPLISLLCSLPMIGLVWFGGNMVLVGALGIGLFVTFVRYTERFFMPIMTLAREIHVIQQAFTSAERVASFLAEAEEEKVLGGDGSIPDPREEGIIAGELHFKEVSMSYQDRDELQKKADWVLNNLSFKISPGEKIGLVGATGCGKTTTVSLLSRLYEFQKGDILLDGYSLRDYKRGFLRKQIGFVSQEVIIFKGSLRENLTTESYFLDEDILKACEVTGFLKVFESAGLNLESEILEGGSNMSIGERQLLSLTRILLNNPSILVLDEATANIDPAHEKMVHSAVNKIMQGRTCLMIAHRLATLGNCDRILVFDRGSLVEEGSRQSLLEKKKGHFYRLQNAES